MPSEPPAEEAAEALAEAAAETPGDNTEALPLPEAAGDEEAVDVETDETPVPQEAQEEVAQLEMLPEPAQDAGSELPADETMLDMGKMNKPQRPLGRGTGRRPALTPRPAPPEAEGEAGGDAGTDEGGDQPKKKGFFGKLFGKKP